VHLFFDGREGQGDSRVGCEKETTLLTCELCYISLLVNKLIDCNVFIHVICTLYPYIMTNLEDTLVCSKFGMFKYQRRETRLGGEGACVKKLLLCGLIVKNTPFSDSGIVHLGFFSFCFEFLAR